jgi:hypothetical protein
MFPVPANFLLHDAENRKNNDRSTDFVKRLGGNLVTCSVCHSWSDPVSSRGNKQNYLMEFIENKGLNVVARCNLL